MIAFGFKSAGFIFKALYSAKDFAKYMEKKIERLMKPYGYRQKGSCTKLIENETAEGFRYEYETPNVGMYAESYVVKHGKFFYYLHFYARSELKNESIKVWNDILSSAKWA